MSFEEAYAKLKYFLDVGSDLDENMLDQLFELMLMSYFSRHSAQPARLLAGALGVDMRHNAMDLLEGERGELALAIIDEIAQLLKRYLPVLSSIQHHELGDYLKLIDAYIQGRHNIILVIPTTHLEKIRNEATQSSR